MFRGFIRYSPRFPVARQRTALEAAGCKVVYEDGKGEGLADAIGSLRKGDALVVDGLHRLAPTRAGVLDALEQIAARGAKVMDARTGRSTNSADAAWVVEALMVLAGEARIPSHAEAVRRGKMGGGKKKKVAMTQREAQAIWLDKTIRTNDEAAARIGLGIRTLYRRFGASGRLAGWPGKK